MNSYADTPGEAALGRAPTPGEIYQREMVPVSLARLRGGPPDLVDLGAVGPGQRVLDVTCGTTRVVTRLAAERAGGAGRVVAYGQVKTTIEIPDPLFRKAKLKAAEHGQTLKQVVTEALQEKLASGTVAARSGEPAWMRGFGQLRRLRRETERIQARIDQAFEIIEPEDRA